MVAQAVHNRGELCEDNPGGRSLQCGVVASSSMNVGSEQLSKVTGPVGA